MLPQNATELLLYHQRLLSDRPRAEGYRRAVLESVRPGDVVVDLGTGTGLLAFFACEAGARRVHAIEQGDIIEIARILARANGWEDRITFHHAPSRRVELPDSVDVIVTETLGHFGLGEGIINSVREVRDRSLKAEGRIVPAVVELMAVPVDLARLRVGFALWSGECYGVDLSAAEPFVRNNPIPLAVELEAFAAKPAPLARIELATMVESEIVTEQTFVVDQDATVNGIAGWFSAQLSPSVSLSNAPPRYSHWRQLVFPLEREISVWVGDTLRLALRSVREGTIWSWSVEHQSTAGNSCRIEQSSFRGFPLSLTRVHRRSPGFIPVLSSYGHAEACVLELMRNNHPLSVIVAAVSERYGELFTSTGETSEFVASIVGRCT